MIRLIAAVDRKGGIAKHGGQPWFIPEDEKYFTDQTQSYGGVILAGSTTFKTFGAPLAKRRNYVLTSKDEPIEGAELVHDLLAFLDGFRATDVWIIGGANVYKQVIEMGKADELYLTHIDADFGCEQFFPPNNFEEVSRTDLREQNGFIFYTAVYRKP